MRVAITNIKDVIPEKNIVVFSPHYDDFTFYLAGYIEELREKALLQTKDFTSVLVFGRSNYTNNAGKSNYDTSLQRIKYCTGLRLIEDIECMNDMLGRFHYSYECCLEDEALVREKTLADSEMEFVRGAWENFDKQDQEIFERVKGRITHYAAKKDTALVFSVAIKEHIDHFIVREAALQAFRELGGRPAANFYFCEDKPYYGIATDEEKQRVQAMIESNRLQERGFRHHPERLIELLFRHYASQVDEIFKIGIRRRAEDLSAYYCTDYPCDRIFVLERSDCFGSPCHSEG